MESLLSLFFLLLGCCWIGSAILRGLIAYLSRINGVFRIIFALFGVLSGGFHELCHLLGFYLCWIPLRPSQYRITMNALIVDVNARVYARISFLKALIIILCPLLIVTSMVTGIVLYFSTVSVTVQYILWGIVGVCGIYCSPSTQDWIVVWHVIQLKPWSFLRQIGEIGLSIGIGYIFTLEWWSSSILLGIELIWNGGVMIVILIRKIHQGQTVRVRPQSIPIQAIFPSHKHIYPKPLEKKRRQKTPQLFQDMAKSRQQMDDLVAQFSWDDVLKYPQSSE